MPREKEQYKYQCKEPGCYLLVRSDKWNNHCKTKHGFKFTRYRFSHTIAAAMPLLYLYIDVILMLSYCIF